MVHSPEHAEKTVLSDVSADIYLHYRMRVHITFVVLFWITQGLSQPHAFITYTPRDGLVNARVRSAYQDSKGRIYFMTYGGLSVYDGVRFKNFTTLDGLSADMVNDVLEIGEDSLLIATNGSLSLNLLIRNKVEKFADTAKPIPIINKFLMDAGGVVYMTSDEGLLRLENNRLFRIPLPQFTPGVSSFLGALCDTGPYLLFTTNDLQNFKGLYLFDKSSETILDFSPEFVVHAMLKDANGRIWILGAGNRLALIDSAELQHGRLMLSDDADIIYPQADDKIVSMAFNNAENWFINSNNRLVINAMNGASMRMTLPLLADMGGVQSMMADRERILWICTNGGGVMKISKPQFTVLQQGENSNREIRFAHIAVTSEGTWHQAYEGNLYHKSDGQLQRISENLPKDARIFGLANGTLYARDEHDIYAATVGNNTTLDFDPVIRSPDTSSFAGVASVYANNGILIGSSSGLIYYQNGRHVFTYPLQQIDLVEALLDREGFLWMVSRHSDIIKFARNQDDEEHLTVDEVFPIKHLKISPRAAIFDDAGYLWIGCRYSGIYVCDVQHDSLKILHRFDARSGLTDMFITCLIKCPDGSILAGTQSGLDRMIPIGDDQYRIENLTKRSNVFVFIRALWLENDGKTFALTNTGNVLEVYPIEENPPLILPQLLIDEVKVNGIAVVSGTEKFGYRENNFAINICAPTFIDEKQVQYSYRLEGGTQPEWSEASPSHASINLLNLSSGDYTLYLRATFPSTVYSPVENQYHFTIRPAWWQTSLAKTALIFLVLGITGLIMFFLQRRKLERARLILEKQTAIQEERTRISGDLHDDLGAGLSTIRFLAEKIKQAKIVVPPPELERIQETSDELTDKMNEIIWAMSEQHDTLDDLLSYTRAYIATYCDEHGLSYHLQFPQEVPHTFVNGQVRRNIFLSIKESLHNIVKHAKANNVYIDIHLNQCLSICIRDDGKGVSQQPLNLKSGHGLGNMKKRIDTLGGTFSIRIDPGVIVEFSVPINQHMLRQK